MNANARQLGLLAFKHLTQAQVYQYMEDQLKRTVAEEAVMEKAQPYVTAWNTAKANFDEAYRRQTTKGQTAVLEDLDKERDPMYSGLHQSILQALKSPIEAQRTAAEQLAEPFDRYKVQTTAEYDEETMRIGQLCQELMGSARLTKALQTLGLKEWAEALQAKNQEFQKALNDRTDAQADYVLGELTELKNALIEAYYNFRMVINAVSIYEGDEAYADYLDRMNAEVQRYKQIIERKLAAAANKKNKKDGDDQKQDDQKQDDGGEQDGSQDDGSDDEQEE